MGQSRRIRHSIDISFSTFGRLALVLAGLWLLYLVRNILLLVFVAMVVSSAIEPLVNKLHKKKIPRTLTVFIVFAVLIGSVGGVLSLLVPVIFEQAQAFLVALPQYGGRLETFVQGWLPQAASESISPRELTDNLASQLGEGLTSLTQTLTQVVRGIGSLVVVIVLSFYFSVQQGSVRAFIKAIVPKQHRPYVNDLVDRMQNQLGRWLRGQLILMVLIFVVTYPFLLLLDVPNALLLASLAGLLEIIPFLGPLFSAIPAVVLGFSVSPWVGFLVIVGYVVIQQLENHILQPRVMGKVLGLNPLVVILAILLGAQLAGVFGAILAVPIVTAAAVFIRDIFGDTEPSDMSPALRDALEDDSARGAWFYKPSKAEDDSDGKTETGPQRHDADQESSS